MGKADELVDFLYPCEVAQVFTKQLLETKLTPAAVKAVRCTQKGFWKPTKTPEGIDGAWISRRGGHRDCTSGAVALR